MPATQRAPEETPARPNLFPTRAAVEHVLSDLLEELRRRGDRLLDIKQVTDRTTLARNTI